MLSLEDQVLAHCKRIYGSRILYKNRSIYIKTEEDIYKIDFSLSNKGIYRFCSTTSPYVLNESCLARGFFKVSAHGIYKEIGFAPSEDDWQSFLRDAHKYKVCQEDNICINL